MAKKANQSLKKSAKAPQAKASQRQVGDDHNRAFEQLLDDAIRGVPKKAVKRR